MQQQITQFAIPFIGVTRSVADRPLVETLVDSSGGVVVRTRSVSVPATKRDLQDALSLLSASDTSKSVAKLLESYDRAAVLEMLEKASA